MSSDRPDDGRLRPMTARDLAQVLAWRNHPEIRRYMFTRHEISLDEHRCWFERVSQDPTRKLLIFEQGKIEAGFVHFSGVSHGGVAEWGFYVAPDAPKGTGRKLGHSALKFGFDEASLHKICGQALDFNEPSIKFHRTLGFREEGVLREQHVDGESYHSVICYGLLRREWTSSRSD